jgi:fatty acid desaturase
MSSGDGISGQATWESLNSRVSDAEAPLTAVNILLTLGAGGLYLASLWAASHAESWILKGVAVVVFALVANTLFSLLHEAVHRVYSLTPWVNSVFGQLCAAFFPTGLTFQRIFHIGHHLRNRTDHEMFDLYYPTDNKFTKYLQFYCIFNGVYWFSVPISWLVYFFFPWAYLWLGHSESVELRRAGVVTFQYVYRHPKRWRIRFELLTTMLFQLGIIWALDLKLWPTLLCFWVFGLAWGALQYADHAWSVRDIRQGAWNLRIHPWIKAIFLNYHDHHVHHAHPRIPWHRLPAHVDPSLPRPSFWTIYWEMWKGPRPADSGPPASIDEELSRQLEDDDLRPLKASEGLSWLRTERLLLVQLWHFSRRNLRYFKAAIGVYLYGILHPRVGRRWRIGLTALQLMDDLLDGDRPSEEEPLELVARARAALKSDTSDGSDVQDLNLAYFRSIEGMRFEAEARAAFFTVIEAMERDRRRVLARVAFPEKELLAHHRLTMGPSVDSMVLCQGSPLRSERDLPELLDLFGWCSTLRDLDEDLARGLVNLPAEVIGFEVPADGRSLLVRPEVRAWLGDYTRRADGWIRDCERKLAALAGRDGASVFRLYFKSMKKLRERGLGSEFLS